MSSSVFKRSLSFGQVSLLLSLDNVTDLCFFLEVERVDFLQFSLKLEEEGALVGLESGLGILQRLASATLLRVDDRRCAQLFNEL